jgi:type I restriction enzyme M protein
MKYGDLTEADVKELVLDDKWQATIISCVASEVEALTLALVSRIHELGERYADTLQDLDSQVNRLEAKVADHLADLGVKP